MKISVLKEAIRQVVREELREVLREELSTPSTTSLSTLVDDEPLYEAPRRRKMNSPKPGNPVLENILNETANSDWRSIGNFGTGDAQHFTGRQSGQPNVAPNATSVEGFLKQNTNPGASDIRQVQVNTVPDFTKMMSTMKTKGMI
jgi:hypothetical protein